MFSKKGEPKGNKNMTVIAEGVTIEGTLHSTGSIRIDGKVKGEIINIGDLIIGREGKVNANVKTKNAIIAGSFRGDMIAAGEIEITSTGKFLGNITQRDTCLAISKGGLFKGESIITENKELFKLETPKKEELDGSISIETREVRTNINRPLTNNN